MIDNSVEVKEMKNKVILMNKYINNIMLLAGILSILGFVFVWVLKIEILAKIMFLLAGLLGGMPIFYKAISALKVKVISIDLLVTIAIVGGILIGEFEESAVVAFLFLFGTYLEQKTLKKTRNAIRELINMAPTTANIVDVNGNVNKISVDELNVGDKIMVKPGDKIPADGIVQSGLAQIDQAMVTGEPELISAEKNSTVFAGTIVENGDIQVEVTKIGDDSTLGKIIELVEEAQDSKSPVEQFIDKFAKYYTPMVLLIATVTLILSSDIHLAITILVLGCPGALVIGAPVSMVAGIGNGAKNGVLLQGGNSVDQMAKIDTFIFDKTNTLTEGKMSVSSIKKYIKLTNEEKNIIKSMEEKSNHPLSKVISNLFSNSTIQEINVETIKGQGLKYEDYLIGNFKLLKENNILLSNSQISDLQNLQAQGDTTVLIARQGKLKMIIGISDKIKADAKSALIKLKEKGAKELVILSGDNKLAVEHVAKQLNVDSSFGELFPEDKVSYLKNYQKNHLIAFIGDGINDSPSLASADIGIAMGSGTDVAIETSDIVLVNSTLENLVYAYSLSKRILNNTKQNIFIAILTVVLLLLGLVLGKVNMASGMLFHELSILIVILNAMRLVR